VRNGGYGELTLLFDSTLLDDRALRLSDEIEEARFFATDALPPLTPGIDHWLGEALEALQARPLEAAGTIA
jgi:hypothetical protein